MSDVEQTHVRPIKKAGASTRSERPVPSSRRPLPSLLAEECLVVGETGADWSAGIAAARRHSPNLSLITQWSGELPQRFSARVVSRLAKRTGFAAVVLVCTAGDDVYVRRARQEIIEAAARCAPGESPRQVCVVCQPDEEGGMPSWVPRMADSVLSAAPSSGISVALAS